VDVNVTLQDDFMRFS